MKKNYKIVKWNENFRRWDWVATEKNLSDALELADTLQAVHWPEHYKVEF